jgi:hypothetical protein
MYFLLSVLSTNMRKTQATFSDRDCQEQCLLVSCILRFWVQTCKLCKSGHFYGHEKTVKGVNLQTFGHFTATYRFYGRFLSFTIFTNFYTINIGFYGCKSLKHFSCYGHNCCKFRKINKFP